MTDDFDNNNFTLDIVDQSKFEKEAGISIDKLISTSNQISLDMLGIKVNVDGKIFSDNRTQYSKTGTGVLNISSKNSNNTLINNVQTKFKEKNDRDKKELNNADPSFPYIKTAIMTDAEKQLYHFMLNNLCQVDRIAIFPKVRLADIIEVDKRITQDVYAFYKIAYKHVDYVICNKNTLETICVVELDDYTHDNKKAKERDLFVTQALYTAGIPVARVKVRIKAIERNDLAYIDELINQALAPNCPKCGTRMFPRSAQDGHRFYACGDFINCRYTFNIDSRGEKLP